MNRDIDFAREHNIFGIVGFVCFSISVILYLVTRFKLSLLPQIDSLIPIAFAQTALMLISSMASLWGFFISGLVFHKGKILSAVTLIGCLFYWGIHFIQGFR